ncbi:MAG: hypothetical protein ACKPE6_10865, partial [Gammaproteobacteria bacterium]
MKMRALVLALGLAMPALVTAEGKAVEELLASVPDAGVYGKHLLHLTEEPHMAGTPRNDALADYVRDRFLEYGLDEAHFHDLPALLAFPKHARLTILEPEQKVLNLAEDPYGPDKDSRLYDDPTQIAFNGYAPSGTVSAE